MFIFFSIFPFFSFSYVNSFIFFGDVCVAGMVLSSSFFSWSSCC